MWVPARGWHTRNNRTHASHHPCAPQSSYRIHCHTLRMLCSGQSPSYHSFFYPLFTSFLLLFTSSGWRFRDVLTPRSPFDGCRIGKLGSIRLWPGLKPITNQVNRFGAKLIDNILCRSCIRDEFRILNMRLLLADQPFDRRPVSTGSFTCYSLNMSAPTYVLCSKGDKPFSRPNLHVIVVTFTAAARFPARRILHLSLFILFICSLLSFHCHQLLLTK